MRKVYSNSTHSDVVPDKKVWEGNYLPYMTCETLSIDWYLTYNYTSSQSFFFISKCPDYVPRESKVRLYCEEPPTPGDVFVTPMSVKSVGHFKNFYCAICHGISFANIQPWMWRWRCDIDLGVISSDNDEQSEKDFTVEHLISLKVCSLALEPPNDIPDELAPRLCFPGVNVTMCSSQYSKQPDTQIKCPSYLAPVQYDGNRYQNLACAYCNGIAVCRDYTVLCESVHYFPDTQRTTLPSLAEYFAFNPGDDESAASSCAVNEAFDPITRGCQVVYCLSGFIYNGTTETCERLPIDEVGRVCLSFYSQSTGQTEVNITSSDVEYLAGAMNFLLVGSPYDLLASTVVLELPQVTCNVSQIEFHDEERCYEQNETMACQACFDIELNFTALMASNTSLVSNTSFWFNDTACYFTPSFGNVSVVKIDIDVPADWTCASYSSFFSGQTNDTLLPPFRVQVIRETGAYKMTALTGEYICRDNLILTCKGYLRADPGQFEFTDDLEDAIRVGTGNTVIGQGQFQRMPNGSVQYCLENTAQSGRNLPKGLDIITMVGTVLSIMSVLAVITTYTVFPKLRNMAGKSVLALSVALLMVFLLMCFGVVSSRSKGLCKAVSAASHFFWLSIFFWMNALAIDLNRIFGSRAKIRIGSKSQIFYVWYSLYAWGTPALIVGACLTIDLCECTNLSFEYGSEGLCWLSSGDATLYGFGVPLAALLFLNTILFSDTVVGIRLTKKASEKALKERPALTRAKEELSLYIKVKDYVLILKISPLSENESI